MPSSDSASDFKLLVLTATVLAVGQELPDIRYDMGDAFKPAGLTSGDRTRNKMTVSKNTCLRTPRPSIYYH